MLLSDVLKEISSKLNSHFFKESKLKLTIQGWLQTSQGEHVEITRFWELEAFFKGRFGHTLQYELIRAFLQRIPTKNLAFSDYKKFILNKVSNTYTHDLLLACWIETHQCTLEELERDFLPKLKTTHYIDTAYQAWIISTEEILDFLTLENKVLSKCNGHENQLIIQWITKAPFTSNEVFLSSIIPYLRSKNTYDSAISHITKLWDEPILRE